MEIWKALERIYKKNSKNAVETISVIDKMCLIGQVICKDIRKSESHLSLQASCWVALNGHGI